MSCWIRPLKRQMFYDRDGWCCVYCHTPVSVYPVGKASEGWPADLATLDHLVPRSCGGKNDVPNLVTACFSCNSARQDRPLREFVEALHGGPGDAADKHLRDIRLASKRRVKRAYQEALLELRVARLVEERIEEMVARGELIRPGAEEPPF